ncbi:hypothetical protein D3C81_1887930 [compost metagenome]
MLLTWPSPAIFNFTFGRPSFNVTSMVVCIGFIRIVAIPCFVSTETAKLVPVILFLIRFNNLVSGTEIKPMSLSSLNTAEPAHLTIALGECRLSLFRIIVFVTFKMETGAS